MARLARRIIGLLLGSLFATSLTAAQPNILLILADDLGYSDIGVFGAKNIRTPNLDRLAVQGARLASHLVASPVCSPSRAGLLTGRYPQRTGVVGVLRDHHDHTGLALDERTIADELSAAGYDTALMGKWHLGVPQAYRPLRRGFAHYFGFLSGTIDYYTHLSRGGGQKGERVLYRNHKAIESHGYFPDRIADELVRYLAEPKEKPFFVFFSLGLPHVPLQAPPGSKAEGDEAVYRAMVERIDHNVGRALQALDERRFARDTLVVFLSDHGWNVRRKKGPGSNRPFRGGKYELTEGGLRTPTMVRWPARIPAGRTLDEPSITLDWLPTFREAAGVQAAAAKPLDGASLLAHLSADEPLPSRTLFWGFQDDLAGTPASYAARRGNLKYLRVGETEALYDLAADPGESQDLAAAQPEAFRGLRDAVEQWRRDVGEPKWVSKPPRVAKIDTVVARSILLVVLSSTRRLRRGVPPSRLRWRLADPRSARRPRPGLRLRPNHNQERRLAGATPRAVGLRALLRPGSPRRHAESCVRRQVVHLHRRRHLDGRAQPALPQRPRPESLHA